MAKRNKNASSSKAAPYEVGKGKPPEAWKFKKGRTGNPRGRPKGSKNVNTIVNEIAFEKISVPTKDGKTRPLLRLEILLMQWAAKAMRGDTTAAKNFVEQLRKAQEETTTNPSQLLCSDEDIKVLHQVFNRMKQCDPKSGK